MLPPGFSNEAPAPQPQSSGKLPPGFPGGSSNSAPATQGNLPPGYTPPAEPHTYDAQITQAASKYGIDPKLLRAVGMQETGLGTGGNFDPKTGLDKDGNKGHGIFQLDPASGASQADLDRAAKDPQFAAEYAARMLSKNLKATGGDTRKALAMYNAGSADSTQGQEYASSAMAFITPENLQHGGQQVRKEGKVLASDFKRVQRMTAHGKPLSKALASTKTLKPVAKELGDATTAWEYARAHPVLTAFDALGSLQRGVGGIADAIEKHEDLKKSIQTTADAIFHPNEKNVARTTESISKALGFASHSDINLYVDMKAKTAFAKAIAPSEKAAWNGASDFTAQTVSDPLTYVGEGLLKAGVEHSGSALRVANALLGKAGISAHFPHIAWAQQVADGVKDVFVPRRDLEKAGFTQKGKKVRIAIENSEFSKDADREAADVAASQDAKASVARLAELAHEHGSSARSVAASSHPTRAGKTVTNPTGSFVVGDLNKEAIKLKGMTPDERLEYFRDARKEITKNEIARRTEQAVKSTPGMHTGTITNYHGLGTGDGFKINVGGKTMDLTGMADLTKGIRTLGKRAVFTNPVPHGVKNVGTLAYLAGGLPAVVNGFKYMIKGVDKATLERMKDIGAVPNYLEHEPAKSLGGKYMQAMNTALTRMEHGWRAGLLGEMDRKLGKHAPGSTEEMLKGYMVNQHLGDYRNQAAFVKMFEALGGPFVAFRLGIVPQNVGKALVNNPRRVMAAYRAETDLQRNRSKHAQAKNSLDVGGPTTDAARLATDPVKYVTSPSTLGPAAMLQAFNGKPLSEILTGLGEAYVPGFSQVEDIYKSLSGEGMPGQHTSVVDKLSSLILSQYGGHMSAEKPKKYWAKEAKKNKKRL